MFSFFKKKENIHEINFRAQFANFRKRYAKELDNFPYGKDFGKVVDEVEEGVLKLVRNPETKIAENINYWNTTVDQILMTLIHKVEYGEYMYRGMPTGATSYFATVYRVIVNDLHKDGIINDEEMKISLNNLSTVIKENG